MSISIVQALILGIFASLSSMPGMGSSSIGNYTLGRPLVGGLVCGLVLGDIRTGILVGVAMQVVYIALVTPGGTVSADVRAVLAVCDETERFMELRRGGGLHPVGGVFHFQRGVEQEQK